MLTLLVCQCAGAEKKSRKILKEAGVEDYLGVACFTGKAQCRGFLEGLPEMYQKLPARKSLEEFIMTGFSYAVILGYDDTRFAWANVKTKDLNELIMGEKIAESFAKN